AVGLDERHRRQRAVIDRGRKIDDILKVRGALGWVAHGRRGVLKWTADRTIGRADGIERIGRAVREIHSGVVPLAVIGPRYAFFVERVTDGAHVGWRDEKEIAAVRRRLRARRIRWPTVRMKTRKEVIDGVEMSRRAVGR